MAENVLHPLKNQAAKEEVTFYFYISLSFLAIQISVMAIGITGLLICLVCIIGYAMFVKSQDERNDNQPANEQTRSETFKSRARVDLFIYVAGLIGMLFWIILLMILTKSVATKIEQAGDNKQQQEEIIKKEVEESTYVLVIAIFASLWMGQIQAVSNIALIIMTYNLVQACCI